MATGMLAACTGARPGTRAGAGGAPALVASVVLHLGVGVVALADAGLRAPSPVLSSPGLAVTVEILTARAAAPAAESMPRPEPGARPQAATSERAPPAASPADVVPADLVSAGTAPAESAPAPAPEPPVSMPPASAEGDVAPVPQAAPRRAPRQAAAKAAVKPTALPERAAAAASPAPADPVRPASAAVPQPPTAVAEPGPPAVAPSAHPGASAHVAAAPAPPAQIASLPLIVTTPRYREPPTPPVYPKRARELDQQGVVLVRALLDSDGNPDEVMVFQSSGYALLDRAAQDAVRRWRFVPARQNGRESAAWVQVPVRFSLQ